MANRLPFTTKQKRQFAARIRNFRVAYAMTQTELAQAMGVGERTIRNMEKQAFEYSPKHVLAFREVEKKFRREENAENELRRISQ